jgi:hypothetical protein
MGIGGGITLIVLGLIFMMNVIEVEIPALNEYSLGVILVLGGIAAIALSLTVWRDTRYGYGYRRGGTRVVEREVIDDGPPPPAV